MTCRFLSSLCGDQYRPVADHLACVVPGIYGVSEHSRTLLGDRPNVLEFIFETNIPAESKLDSVMKNELNHYIRVVGGSELRNKANYDEKKERHVYALLEFLGTLRSVPSNSWGLSVCQCSPCLRYLS